MVKRHMNAIRERRPESWAKLLAGWCAQLSEQQIVTRRQTGTMFWNILSAAMPLCLVFVWVCRRVQTCFEFVNCLHVEYPQFNVFVLLVFYSGPRYSRNLVLRVKLDPCSCSCSAVVGQPCPGFQTYHFNMVFIFLLLLEEMPLFPVCPHFQRHF